MNDSIAQLYAYSAWAHRRVWTCLESQNVQDEAIRKWFGHILVAQLVWLNRIEGKPAPSYGLWEIYPLETLGQLVEEVNHQWEVFLSGQHDLSREVHYTNMAGSSFSTRMDAILLHAVNHGTYHRGQIAARIRQIGLEPVNTDFITYNRMETGQSKG